MAIIRHKLNDYQHGEAVLTKRDPEDFDLGWGDNRIYVLDAHEWWDPHTSSKYETPSRFVSSLTIVPDGVSRHAMIGPSVIVYNSTGGGSHSHEYHVNDPSAWAPTFDAVSTKDMLPKATCHLDLRTRKAL
jgi:hypothetical protein